MAIMSFEDYLNLIGGLADEKLTGDKDKFFDILNKLKENAKDAASKGKAITASTKEENHLYIPSKYKNQDFAKVLADFPEDYIDAYEDMKDPEKYAAILSILNEKLAKDGDPYDVSTPENKILGLANRYANNARECQYNRQWRLFAFYMRSLAYFIPQLIHQANMTEEKIMNKIEAKFTRLTSGLDAGLPQTQLCECEDEEDYYAEDESESGLTASIAIEASDPVSHVIEAAGGTVYNRDEKQVDSIALKPMEWCYYVSKNGMKYTVHNNRGKLVAFKNGLTGTHPADILPDMKKKITTAASNPNLKGADTMEYKGYKIAEWPTGTRAFSNIQIVLKDGSLVGHFKNIKEAKQYIDSGKIKRHEVKAKADTDEAYKFFSSNQKKIDDLISSPFRNLIMKKSKNLVVSEIRVDSFIPDRVYNDKDLRDNTRVYIDFKSGSKKGRLSVAFYGDSDFEISLTETPFTIRSNDADSYSSIIQDYSSIVSELDKKEVTKAWDTALSDLKNFMKKNKIL